MELKTYFAQDQEGRVLPEASVFLYLAGTTELASDVRNEVGTSLPNPFSAGNDGLIQLAAPDGKYDLRVSKGGMDYTMRVQFLDAASAISTIALEADRATSQADRATSQAEQAEVARDTAYINANVYESIASGLAGTADSEQFQVVAGGSEVIRYRNDSGSAKEVARYPYASEDVIGAFRNAISAGIGVAYTSGERNLEYTHSLEEGGPENRPPMRYADRLLGASGVTFLPAAPSLFARRQMLNIKRNTNRHGVSIVTGIPASDQPANGQFLAGIAWYGNNRARLLGEDNSTIAVTLSADSFGGTEKISFTFGPIGSGADIVPPSSAVYALPFFEFTGIGFQYFSSQLSVERLDRESRIAANERMVSGTSDSFDILSVFRDGDRGNVFDFTNPALMERLPVEGAAFPTVRDMFGDMTVSGDATALRIGNSLHPGQADSDTEGRRTWITDTTLLPEQGDFTIALSCCMSGPSTGNRTVLWQHNSGAPGRVQFTRNARFDGSIQAPADEMFQAWIDGITDGNGVAGQPAPAEVPRGKPLNMVMVCRDGAKASELWVNGRLIDTFTRPPVIHQGTTYLLGAAGSAVHSGNSYGRITLIDRAVDAHEIHVLGEWVSRAYSDPWVSTVLANSTLIKATGAVSYLISAPSPPSLIDDYQQMQPLFLRGYQQVLYPASMTKVLTTIVMLNNIDNLQDTIEMQPGDETGGSGNNLYPGDIITYEGAIYNMMLPSSNVTAMVIARVIGTLLLNGQPGDPVERFIDEMNARAKALGMHRSNFTNPSGLANSKMVTTPEDMGRLCASVVSYPDILSRWGMTSYELQISGPNARTESIAHSAGTFIAGSDDIQGGKTGTVSVSPKGTSTQNFMCINKLPGGNYAASVVMLTESDHRYDNMRAMLEFIKTSYRWPVAMDLMPLASA